MSQKEAELNLKTKDAELEKAKQLLENATITAPIAGRIQSINESGTDSQGNPAAYITIHPAGRCLPGKGYHRRAAAGSHRPG